MPQAGAAFQPVQSYMHSAACKAAKMQHLTMPVTVAMPWVCCNARTHHHACKTQHPLMQADTEVIPGCRCQQQPQGTALGTRAWFGGLQGSTGPAGWSGWRWRSPQRCGPLQSSGR